MHISTFTTLKNPLLSGAVLLVLSFIFSQNIHAQNRPLKAGASLSNITPPLGEEIVGNWNTPAATYIHDDLHARTLVLDDGHMQLIFVIADNVSIKREVYDAAKHIIHHRTGIPMEHMMMAATHTHSGTSAGKKGSARRGWQYGEPLDEYQQFLARRIADGVMTAIGNLEPARIAWGAVDVPEHVFNRRWHLHEPVWSPLGEKDQVQMNPARQSPALDKPAGPVDPELSFLAVESADGRPISLLANYSLHYVGGVPSGHISADYFAVFADRIGELLKADRQDPPFVGIMSNGTSGDVNNINFTKPAERKKPYEKMKEVAFDLADKVMARYPNLEFEENLTLDAMQKELRLAVRKPDEALKERMEKIRNHPASEPPIYHNLEKTYANRVAQIEKEWPDSIDIIIQTFRIGDIGVAAVPFETFAETGLEIKEKSPFQHTFTIELANGEYGYLPTPEQHLLGGYETWISTNRVEKQTTVKMVDALQSLFKNLYNHR